MNVTDADGNPIVSYEYDSEGRRVEMSDERGTRDYLVAPNPGDGLASPHLISDATGDPLAAYVYAGSMPLMRLDEQNNPVYYLEDGMGSVIGLAGAAGAAVETFKYDAFGNLREGGTTDVDELGGDFRFQGHWLESNTDFYHFRARYYDPEAGRFMSRDPVDVIESEPESSNPYQFVYNNLLIYSDPTGAITLTELQVGESMENALRAAQNYSRRETIDYVKGELGEALGNIFLNAIENAIPLHQLPSTLQTSLGFMDGLDLPTGKKSLGYLFELFVKDSICHFFGGYTQNIWFEPEIFTNGEASFSGHRCPRTHNGGFEGFPTLGDATKPDFIFSSEAPRNSNDYLTRNNARSWLIGDIKLSNKTIYNDYFNDAIKDKKKQAQWKSMVNYSKKHSYSTVGLISFFYEGPTYKKKILKGAAKSGVGLLHLSLGIKRK